MIGYSIIMFFAGLVLFFTAIGLLRGNTSAIHGKVFEQTQDKKGYARDSGKIVLFFSIGAIVSGLITLFSNSMTGLTAGVIELLAVFAGAIPFIVIIQKKYRS